MIVDDWRIKILVITHIIKVAAPIVTPMEVKVIVS